MQLERHEDLLPSIHNRIAVACVYFSMACQNGPGRANKGAGVLLQTRVPLIARWAQRWKKPT